MLAGVAPKGQIAAFFMANQNLFGTVLDEKFSGNLYKIAALRSQITNDASVGPASHDHWGRRQAKTRTGAPLPRKIGPRHTSKQLLFLDI